MAFTGPSLASLKVGGHYDDGMAPRPTLPSDDLYGRLELPNDASPEAVEIAWRALLRRHHPDVAGPTGLERAKQINVAHDWLSDPHLRARYDRERGIRSAVETSRHRGARGAVGRPAHRRPPLRPVDPIAQFLERVAGLTVDELDRLALADPAPIAFVATIRRFLPDDRRAALEGIDAEIGRRLAPDAAGRPGVRDTARAYATELVLGSFLDELLSEPFRDRTRERLCRGWEAAIDQPRYGPNGSAVETLIARLARLGPSGIAALADGGVPGDPGDPPWPNGTSPDDDEALRVSSVLAARDAAAAVPEGDLARAVVTHARRTAARLAHLLVLRHAFSPAGFDALTRPWQPHLVPRVSPAPSLRRPPLR
jgi:curved DNA-binding protein CbpA